MPPPRQTIVEKNFLRRRRVFGFPHGLGGYRTPDRLLNDRDYDSPHMGFIRMAWHTVDEASVTVVCFSSIGVLGGKAAGKAGVVEFERSAISGQCFAGAGAANVSWISRAGFNPDGTYWT
jgi:hypothetical protein